jgi:tRNA (cmo5U34)-methyltransferase
VPNDVALVATVVAVSEQWHFDPASYFEMIYDEIPAYDELQHVLADATRTVSAASILDLGSGTGVTARHVLDAHPGAALVGLDSSDHMLAHARTLVPEASFTVGELEGELPPGPFDLVTSAFAIHHLDGAAKAELFGRIADVLRPGGRFVLLDVVTPVAPVERPVPLEPGVDVPSSVDDQLRWLADAGLEPRVIHASDDLAVLAAEAPTN